MKKALIYASVASMIEQFNRPNIALFRDLGYEVEVACNFTNGSSMPVEAVQKFREELREEGINTYDVPIPRSPLKIKAIFKAYRLTKKIIEENKFEKVHCHSPIGGLICRIAARKIRKKTQLDMIYTAHGFHFYKGAPIKNWILFYPIEWICSFITDKLILLNQEDYERAKKRLHAKSTYLIHGVGVDFKKSEQALDEKENFREENKLLKSDILLFSVGELNDNKNHLTVIKALKEINNPSLKYFISGRGILASELEDYIHDNNLDSSVKLLGYRTDIRLLLPQMDFFIMPSKREGLPVSLIEAMGEGLPAIVSNIRGNIDLIQQEKGGLQVSALSVEEWSKAIVKMSQSAELRHEYGQYNLEFIKAFGTVAVMEETKKIYLA